MELINRKVHSKGILPKIYAVRNDSKELLRYLITAFLNEINDDILWTDIGIFLNKFVLPLRPDDGVFFTPKSLVKRDC